MCQKNVSFFSWNMYQKHLNFFLSNVLQTISNIKNRLYLQKNGKRLINPEEFIKSYPANIKVVKNLFVKSKNEFALTYFAIFGNPFKARTLSFGS